MPPGARSLTPPRGDPETSLLASSGWFPVGPVVPDRLACALASDRPFAGWPRMAAVQIKASQVTWSEGWSRVAAARSVLMRSIGSVESQKDDPAARAPATTASGRVSCEQMCPRDCDVTAARLLLDCYVTAT